MPRLQTVAAAGFHKMKFRTFPPARVAITGARGSVGTNLAFRVAMGDMLGVNQPVILHLYSRDREALRGLVLELEDTCAPLLAKVVATDNYEEAFGDADYACLVGSPPRQAGMERSDLLQISGALFKQEGTVLGEVANKDCKVVVVGNPANTNALIAASNSKHVPAENFTAMTRLDHNRGLLQLAHCINGHHEGLDIHPTHIDNFVIWGNHSPNMYPDVNHATVRGRKIKDLLPHPDWITNEFMTRVQQRGKEIIEAAGKSSAPSAAMSCVDQMRDWALGSDNKWVSMAVIGKNKESYGIDSYGVDTDLCFSFPVITDGESWTKVGGLEMTEFGYSMLQRNVQELKAERDMVRNLMGWALGRVVGVVHGNRKTSEAALEVLKVFRPQVVYLEADAKSFRLTAEDFEEWKSSVESDHSFLDSSDRLEAIGFQLREALPSVRLVPIDRLRTATERRMQWRHLVFPWQLIQVGGFSGKRNPAQMEKKEGMGVELSYIFAELLGDEHRSSVRVREENVVEVDVEINSLYTERERIFAQRAHLDSIRSRWLSSRNAAGEDVEVLRGKDKLDSGGRIEELPPEPEGPHVPLFPGQMDPLAQAKRLREEAEARRKILMEKEENESSGRREALDCDVGGPCGIADLLADLQRLPDPPLSDTLRIGLVCGEAHTERVKGLLARQMRTSFKRQMRQYEYDLRKPPRVDWVYSYYILLPLLVWIPPYLLLKFFPKKESKEEKALKAPAVWQARDSGSPESVGEPTPADAERARLLAWKVQQLRGLEVEDSGGEVGGSVEEQSKIARFQGAGPHPVVPPLSMRETGVWRKRQVIDDDDDDDEDDEGDAYGVRGSRSG
ncbi:hypothetical protein FOL46_005423 [Perkinsus olseni]|uniref:malate dehydrogenase n=1 Tax=Perkinsus olseni TaxID=32597 RepID=A0A7J6LS81_PEROL|nr:hypothetical protein FOL46_005423 [Perkinsus olseni]